MTLPFYEQYKERLLATTQSSTFIRSDISMFIAAPKLKRKHNGKFQFILLFFISCNSFADWNAEDGFKWKYDCENTSEVTSVVFLLHEASIVGDSEFVSKVIQADNSHPLFPSLLESCSLLVAPESGVHKLGGIPFHVWDYTGYFTYGQEVSQIIDLVILAKELFNKPIYLLGGAAGGIMSYHVATKLVSLGHSDLLSGLVLLDMISFRSLSVTGIHPAAYERLNSVWEYEIFGTAFYELPDEENTYVQLGFVSNEVVWTIPTLIIYSKNDQLLPEYLKEDFANKLLVRSTQTGVLVRGDMHDVGVEGLQIIKEWILSGYS